MPWAVAVLAKARSPTAKRETLGTAIRNDFIRRAFQDVDGNDFEQTCEKIQDFISLPTEF